MEIVLIAVCPDQHLSHARIRGADTGLTLKYVGATLEDVTLAGNKKGIIINHAAGIRNKVTRLVNCDISGNEDGSNFNLKSHLEIINSSFNDQLNIHRTGEDHIFLNISNCTFSYKGYNHNLLLENLNETSIRIKHSDFTNQQSFCLRVLFEYDKRFGNVLLQLEDSTFENSEDGIYLETPDVQTLTFVLHNCSLTKIKDKALHIYTKYWYWYKKPAAIKGLISNSEFFQVGQAIKFDENSENFDLNITDCSFVANNRAVHLHLQRNTTLLIRDNTFINHTDSNVVEIKIKPSYHGLLAIRNNSFHKNTVSSVITQVGSMNRTIIQRNLIYNPQSLMELTTTSDVFSHTGSLNASLNWWGTTSRSVIMSRIHAFHLDPTKANIIFSPILFEADAQSQSIGHIDNAFTAGKNKLCGTLTKNTILPSGDYIVECTINIPVGFTLTITAPSTLRFNNFTGISVSGK